MVFTSLVQSEPATDTPAGQVSVSAALRPQLLNLWRPLTSGQTAGETHHFFLPMRNFFFMKTMYFMGTQTSRAVEVT